MLEKGNSCPQKNCFYVENDLIRRLTVEVVSFVSGLIHRKFQGVPSHVVITPPYHSSKPHGEIS